MTAFNPERWRQLEVLIDQFLDLSDEGRTAFMDALGREKPQLRDELEALLNAGKRGDALLGAPSTDQLARLLAHAYPVLPQGHRIGPYEVVEALAHGGMGEVYLARRADGAFDQFVALKLIRAGLASDSLVRRFLTERQILARLQHEHIARLLDGGLTETDRPYLVMEYIDGQPITEYCDERKLNLKARLRLFEQVGQAVEYAHRNLIVHRDLKPSNILVTDDGVVKLLDFGIAKLLIEDAAGESVTTHTERPILTPQYAAPEQVRGDDITTATDVYALGVLLYELLTGHRPYRVPRQGRAELERVICETRPEAPSHVVRETKEVYHADGTTRRLTPETISRTRSLSPERLRRQLQGDLDTMILMALRKEPERRYQSVEQLREDIRRHLDGLPVQAQSDTAGYRLRKFVRRHRLGVMMSSILLFLTSVVVILSVQRAIQAEELERRASKLEAVQEFLVGLFEVSDVNNIKNQDIKVRELLDHGVSQIKALEKEPEIYADMSEVLGIVYRQMGMYDASQPLLEKALVLQYAAYGAEHEEVATSLHELAYLLDNRGDYDQAELLYRKALAIRRKVFGTEHEDVASSLNELGWVLLNQGRFEEAETLIREGLAIRQRLYGEEHLETAMSLSNLGSVMYARELFNEAEIFYRTALSMRRKLLGYEHPLTAISLGNLASVIYAKRDYVESEKIHREVLDLKKKLLGNKHPSVAFAINNLGTVLYRQGKMQEAEASFRDALALWQEIHGQDHLDITYSLNWIGRVLREKGEYAEAERVLTQSLAMRRRLLGSSHPAVYYSLHHLGRVLLDQQRPAEAEPLLREALALRIRHFGEDDPIKATTELFLGTCLTVLDRYEEAEPLLLDGYEQLNAQNHELTDEARQSLVALYTAWHRPEQAAAYMNVVSAPVP